MMMFGFPCYWTKIPVFTCEFVKKNLILSDSLVAAGSLWRTLGKHDFRSLEIAFKLGFVYLKVILIRRCLFARIHISTRSSSDWIESINLSWRALPNHKRGPGCFLLFWKCQDKKVWVLYLDYSPESQRLEPEIPLLWTGKSSWVQHILWIPDMFSGALVKISSVQTKLTFSSLETIVEWTHCMRTAQKIWQKSSHMLNETSPNQPPNQKNTRTKKHGFGSSLQPPLPPRIPSAPNTLWEGAQAPVKNPQPNTTWREWSIK